MNGKIPCYVSYRRHHCERPEYLKKLVEICPNDIELKIDDSEIASGDNFTHFMEDLMSADHLLLVLSETYFQSEHCVAELVGASEHRDSLAGVAFVYKEDDWVLDKESPGRFREYWVEQAKKPGLTIAEKDRYRHFADSTDHLFTVLRPIAMEPLPAVSRLDQAARPLWDFIRKRHRIHFSARGAVVEPPEDKAHAAYLRKIEASIDEALRSHSALCDSVAHKLGGGGPDPGAIAQTLVSRSGQNFGKAIGILYQAIESALLRASGEQRPAIKRAAKSCYFTLLRVVVDASSLKGIENQRFVRLVEKSVHAAEFSMAGRQRRNLRYLPDGKPEGDLGYSRVEWGDAPKRQLDGLLTYLWNQMAGLCNWAGKNADEILSEEEREMLNAEICQAREDGEGKFVSLLDETDFGHVFTDTVLAGLQEALPCLDIVSLGAEGGRRVFALGNVGNPGHFIQTRIHKLHTLLEKYP